MKPRRKLLLQIFGGLILFAALLIWAPWRHETTYKGHKTSYWVKRSLQGNLDSETLDALKAIGPDAALPLLKAMKNLVQCGIF